MGLGLGLGFRVRVRVRVRVTGCGRARRLLRQAKHLEAPPPRLELRRQPTHLVRK